MEWTRGMDPWNGLMEWTRGMAWLQYKKKTVINEV